MNAHRLFIILGSLMIGFGVAAEAKAVSQLHEYNSYTPNIDPRRTYTTSDYMVSQALGSCLVKYSEDGLVVAGLSDRWKVTPGEWIEFHLNENAKWSDGRKITAADVVVSFENSRKNFYSDLPESFDWYTKVEATSPATIRFFTQKGVPSEKILPKLTFPHLGIFKISEGKYSGKISSGPYFLLSENKAEVVLSANHHWLRYSPRMIEEIHLRHPLGVFTPLTLNTDPWPDFVSLGMGAVKQELSALPADTTIWRINNDRILALNFGGRSDVDATRALIGRIRSEGKLAKLADLMDGAQPATQIYPKGIVLHSETEPKIMKVSRAEFVRRWKNKQVRIAYVSDRLPAKLKEFAENALKDSLPLKLEFIGVKVKDQELAQKDKRFDLLMTSTGVDPSNLDGELSGAIESTPEVYPSDETPLGNFKERLKAARKSKDPTPHFREILTDVVENNYYLPIANFSSTIVGRGYMDFSQVPKAGEYRPYHSFRRKD